MWPREVFYHSRAGDPKKLLAKELAFLDHPGVYVLYRDDVPYYIGRATRTLRSRLLRHADAPKTRYYNFRNFFSAFIVEDKKHLNEIEGILIAAMPTANSSEPRFLREKLTKPVIDMIRDIRRTQANPIRSSKQPFRWLGVRLLGAMATSTPRLTSRCTSSK